jgi:hypothetical protein
MTDPAMPGGQEDRALVTVARIGGIIELSGAYVMSANVDKILQAVQELSPEERSKLGRMLAANSSGAADSGQGEQLRQQLAASGLLSHVPPRGKDAGRFRNWRPVEINGPPLSHTIVEERR